MQKNPLIRSLLFTLGVLSLILGIIGIFLPVLPTTPFVLLATWCFLNSSPKAHAFIRQQPWIRKLLDDWEQRRAISRRAKIQAVSMMALSAILIWMKVDPIEVRVGVSFFLAVVSIFILTRPE